MAVYLKEFENHTQYENYINGSGVKLPNVSICTTEGDVHYNPSTPPTPSHDFVEIGGIKWATMNIGASQPSDYGLYFAWGDTQGYTAEQVGSGEGQKYVVKDRNTLVKMITSITMMVVTPSTMQLTVRLNLRLLMMPLLLIGVALGVCQQLMTSKLLVLP